MKIFARGRISRMVLCAAVVAAGSAAVSAQPSGEGASHPFGASRPIADRYIVVFKDSVANPAAEAAGITRAAGGQLHHTYSAAIKGFAATLPAAALQGLRNNPNVNYVEQDQTVSLSQSEWVQNSATWGLDRVDQRTRPLDLLYNYGYTGAGVHAFIIDTGIRASHTEFTGRVLSGYNTVSTDTADTNDCNGHGTHVAGTVGGITWGVAKQVSLTPVRVLNCRGSGTWSGVIAGIDWVANSSRRPAVANMSLGGGKSASVNAAVAGAVTKGVTMAVAAGNDNANACNYSPASEPSALTVGATTSADLRASYSNFGTCVDIFAPGSSITSAWYTSDAATNTISGTSMATPHVTGVAALAAQANTLASPAGIASFLLANATPNVLSSQGTGSPNLLLYSLGTGPITEPPVKTVAVKGLTGKSSFVGKGAKVRGWQAQVTVTVQDVTDGSSTYGSAVANATVTGSFVTGSSGSCVTAMDGTCSISSGTLSLDTGSTVFTPSGITGTSLSYDGSKNSPTWIEITKP